MVIKYTFYFVFVVLISLSSTRAQWVKCTGFSNEDVRCLITAEDNIYAGTIEKGIYVSSNNGNNWTQTSLNNKTVWTFALIGTTIYAGSDGFGVFQTINKGVNWTQTTLNNYSITALVSNGDNIYAGTAFNGIYRSTNKGSSWTQTSLNNKQILAMISVDNNLYAGVAHEGIYLSSNSGSNWSKTSFPGDAWSFTKTDNTIFAGAFYGGVYLSANNGTSWSQVALAGTTVYSMASYQNSVFAGTYQSGIYLSENKGSTWREINQGLPASIIVKSILIKDGTVFAGTDQGVWRRSLSEITAVEKNNSEVPAKFNLQQNYPNPFNPATTIEYSLPKSGQVILKVLDVSGREITTLVNEYKSAGNHTVNYTTASSLSSGVYFYQVSAGGMIQTKKMLLMK